MHRAVFWRDKARAEYHAIIAFYEEEGRISAAYNFSKNVLKRLDKIVQYPETGKPSPNHPNVRYLLIDKHNRLYYKHFDEKIVVLTIFNARQNPNKLKF